MKVLLGVSGGIAAYKAAELVRVLRRRGAEVTVVPTAAALRFVGVATFEALSGNPVRTDLWTGVEDVPHVRLGREAELLVVAPATADLLARAAHGLADDLLTNTLLTATCPVLMAPAMHTEMWRHAATAANVATLRARGVHVLEPDDGPLTSGDSGRGRLPEPSAIADAAFALLHPVAADLAGRHVVVSAGGTREALDPVRFLGNRSSGRQGWALARAALARGAQVTLIAANVSAEPDLADPPGARVVRVRDTAELRAAVLAAADGGADVVVMAAAVADFRPASTASSKLKRSTDGSAVTIELVQNPDVLAELGSPARRARFPAQVLVGFAAETDPDLGAARAKLARKGADLLVLNEVGAGLGFEVATNAAVVLGADGSVTELARAPKSVIADRVLDLAAALLGPGSAGQVGEHR